MRQQSVKMARIDRGRTPGTPPATGRGRAVAIAQHRRKDSSGNELHARGRSRDEPRPRYSAAFDAAMISSAGGIGLRGTTLRPQSGQSVGPLLPTYSLTST